MLKTGGDYEKEIRFIDLFGGIGGFRLGLEECNDERKNELEKAEFSRPEEASEGRDSESREHMPDIDRKPRTSRGGKSPTDCHRYRKNDKISIDTQQGIGGEKGRPEPRTERSWRRNIKELHRDGGADSNGENAGKGLGTQTKGSPKRQKEVGDTGDVGVQDGRNNGRAGQPPEKDNAEPHESKHKATSARRKRGVDAGRDGDEASRGCRVEGQKKKPAEGGMERHLPYATRKNGDWRTQRASFRCVWYCDNNRYATSVYNRRFNERWKPTDIATVNAEDVPDHDLLCGGFPCQSFSVAGRRKGFQDTRGTLFFEICRIAQAKRPRLLLLENVKGLLSHDQGRTFATVLVSLDELGYDVEWQVLNSKDFGVPQNRERVFIVGHLRGGGGREVFPLGGADGKDNALRQIARIGKRDNMGQRVYDKDGIACSVRSQGGGQGAKTGLYDTTQTIANTVTPDAYLTRGERKRVDGKAVLTSMHERRIRRLTPTECERLQSFPDDWTKTGINEKGEPTPISDTQRYKCLGNAVTVNVVEAIGVKMLGAVQ